jgi:hypothetical protein
MSLTKDIARAIEWMGTGSLITLKDEFSKYTPEQVRQGIQSAVRRKLIHRVGYEGGTKGQQLGIYAPGPGERAKSLRRVSSVWELGATQ